MMTLLITFRGILEAITIIIVFYQHNPKFAIVFGVGVRYSPNLNRSPIAEIVFYIYFKLL